MISNLVVKSNLIESSDDNALKRLAAMDLHSISERNPLRGSFFDERTRYSKTSNLPTDEQNEQWTSRLFWGDKTIGLENENRNVQWIIDIADQIFPIWDQLKGNLDLEFAKEWLWFCNKVDKIGGVSVSKSKEIQKEIQDYLTLKGLYDKDSMEQLLKVLDGTIGG